MMSTEMKQQTLLIRFMMNKRWSFVRHLILLLPLASVFMPNFNTEAAKKIENYQVIFDAVLSHGIFMFCLSLVLIYFNLVVLLPRLLFKNRYLYYALAVIGLATVYFMGEYLHGNYVYKGFEKYIELPAFSVKNFIDNILLPLVFLGATSGYKVFKKWVKDTQRLNDLQNAQLQEELTNLKNQVNPHFMFNTLNNLNTLVQTNPAKASQVILGLSDVLRYQIYDSTKEKILLSKDITMLEQFLMLEKIRRDNFRYEIITDGDLKGTLVPPLLFINFIDNALKHGADTRETSFCKLKFTIRQTNIQFECINSKPSVITKKETGGIGLKNIRRRLDLLYSKNYSLSFIDEPNLFSVKLCIPL